MFTTIFGKIMLLFMIIILVSLYIAGALTSQVMRTSYVEDTGLQLSNMADDAAIFINSYNQGLWSEDYLMDRMLAKANANQSLIWWIKRSGDVVLFGTQSLEESISEQMIKDYFYNMQQQLNKGETVIIETEKPNFFSTPVTTIAKPMLSPLGNEYVFVHKSQSALESYLTVMYRQIALSIMIAAMLAIIVTSIFTRYMLRPLRVVTKGARQLARGHFDIRLFVKSKDEIGQLAHTFNSMAEDLKKYQQTKDTFVANVSHELRSPLTSMQGLLEGVIDGVIPENERLHYLNIVLDETKRLSKLVNDMLDLAKLESGSVMLKLEKTDVNEVVRRVIITFESKIDVKNLIVEVEFEHERELALVNPGQLTQVLQNLVENAIKFAEYSGRLRVSTRSDDKNVYISVNNSGEPISRADLPYLFDRFYKGDTSHTRVKEGAGIGLSLVKKILEEHRQKIWVESDKIGGTTFTFTLEKFKEPAPPKQPRVPKPSSRKKSDAQQN